MSELPTLSPAELSRYSRHILLDQIGVEGQRRLAASRVLVIGAGGLGSPAALYLAASGIGTLGLVDFDRVEEHNLQRQLLHTQSSVGRPKVESAARRLAEINPFIRVRTHSERVTAENALTLFNEYDLIVDGSDNFSTRYLNNDAAFLAKKPLVYASVFKFEGQLSVFAPHLGGPCYRCLFPEPPEPGTVPNCGEAGVLGALCGVVGSWQALEAIKLIAGFGEPLIGTLLNYDGLSQRCQRISLPRDPNCALCGAHPRLTRLDASAYDFSCAPVRGAATSPQPTMDDYPLEISVQNAKRLIDAGEGVHVLDVRETYEREIGHIKGSEHIPLRQIPEYVGSLPRDRQLLIYCHHGNRSMRATEFLRARGFSAVTNIAGGIDAWSQEIDPSVRRY